MHLSIPRSTWICLIVFCVAVLLIWPVAEIGVMDDWSIARTALDLAQTGHVLYNGWEAPMLGWPLFVAAPLIRAFGFSYTLVRLTTAVEALATVLLMQRTFVLAGLSEGNSVLGTLTVALSPIFMMTSVTFMTDVPGVLAVVVALYACLNATKATSDRSAAGWLFFAAVANALLGTTRQVAWLGIVVVVPCALLLVRSRRRVLLGGLAGMVVGGAIILLSLHWFGHQPYVLPEHLLPPRAYWRLRTLPQAGKLLCLIGLDLLMFSLPAAFTFLGGLRESSRRAKLSLAGSSVLLIAVYVLAVAHRSGTHLLAPFLLYTPIPAAAENTFTNAPVPIMGPTPQGLSRTFQICLTCAILLGLCCLAGSLAQRLRRGAPRLKAGDRDVLVLTVPFLLAYLAAMLPRAVWLQIAVDRYLIFLLPVVVLLLLRASQRISPPAPRSFLLPVLVLGAIGAYSVLTLHDVFALYRAHAAAIAELRASGVPQQAIDGGMEYNRTTQILLDRYVRAGGIRLPDGSILQASPALNPMGPCVEPGLEQTPVVQPQYATAYEGTVCTKAEGFAPVRFTAWLPPFHRMVYVVHYGPPQP